MMAIAVDGGCYRFPPHLGPLIPLFILNAADQGGDQQAEDEGD